MSFFNKIKTKPNRIDPCNMYSSKQTELTGYDAAYAKELSSVRQQQSQVTTKLSDDDNKLKLNTDTIAELNQKKPQLESQIAPLEKERAAAQSMKDKLLKDQVPAETTKANLEKQKTDLEKQKIALENQKPDLNKKIATANAKARGWTGMFHRAAAIKLNAQLAGLNSQIAAKTIPITNINNQINAQTKIISDIKTKINAEDAKIKSNNDKIKSINDQIKQTQTRLTELNTAQTQLKSTRDGNNLLKTQLTKTESDTNNKIVRNKEDLVKVLKDKADCENKGSACGIAKKQIEDQKKQLKQYEDELAVLNKQYTKCNSNYEEKCSASQRNALTKIITDRNTKQQLLDSKQTDYKKDCEGKMQNCDPLYSKFQKKQATYDFENIKKNQLYSEYKTCMDQKKNDCNDIHRAANSNKSSAGINIDMIKQREGFTQYSGNADTIHAKIVTNYKSVQSDYTKLTQNIQELNNANNNDNSKTSRYASKKQLYDNAIYTNILLTALATSMLYYVFVDI